MDTELGRIAALSQQGTPAPDPLELQVRRVTWIVAAISVVVGVAFLPAGLGAGLGWAAAITFSIGLIVANVPEGLLPTITLALAAGVQQRSARRRVKRLSAVDTLGSVTVNCTDKTGTLTQNRMRATRLWLSGAELDVTDTGTLDVADPGAPIRVLGATAAACTIAKTATGDQPGSGDPTELALLTLADWLSAGVSTSAREAARLAVFHLDRHLQRMTTIDRVATDGPTQATAAGHTKGAPQTLLPCLTSLLDAAGDAHPLDGAARTVLQQALDGYAADGLRVLAVARRVLPAGAGPLPDRAAAETGLVRSGSSRWSIRPARQCRLRSGRDTSPGSGST